MRSVPITAYVPEPVAKKLRQDASRRKISVSGYLVRLIESAGDRKSKSGGEKIILADLEEDEKHVVGKYDSVSELLESLHEDRKNSGIC
jgi:hypothetical protein